MPQFCPHCGSQLEPDAIFCPNCGQRIVADASQADFGSDNTVQLPRGDWGQVAVGAASMPTPIQSPSWEPANGSLQNGSGVQGTSYPKANAKLIAAIGGAVAAGALAVALVLNFVVLPSRTADGQATQAAQQQTSDKDSTTGAGQAQNDSNGATNDQTTAAAQQEEERAKADSKAAAADAQATVDAQADSQFHASLVSYYQRLSDYDTRIKSTATDFNNNYLNASLSSRESYSSSATSLMDDLEATRDDVYALSVPPNTSYSTQYSQIKTCYDYNVSRLSCIVEAWGIDTGYSDPSSHRDEILAPISRDSNSSNHNKYKAEFDSLYPTISL